MRMIWSFNVFIPRMATVRIDSNGNGMGSAALIQGFVVSDVIALTAQWRPY
jgi:hypothetical protein